MAYAELADRDERRRRAMLLMDMRMAYGAKPDAFQKYLAELIKD